MNSTAHTANETPDKDNVASLGSSTPPGAADASFEPLAGADVFALIAQHREAYAQAEASGITDEERGERTDVADVVLDRLLATVPRDQASVRVLTEYMQGYVKGGDWEQAERTLDTLVDAYASMPEATIPPNQLAYTVLDRPTMRSTSERLSELCDEHYRIIGFYNVCSYTEDLGPKEGREEAKLAEQHASRMLREVEGYIQAIPSRSIHDLGRKARVLSWSRADWWDEPETEEPGTRALVDDILNLAGMDRIRRSDTAFSELLPGYAGPPQHVASKPLPQSALRPQPQNVERLFREWGEAITLFNRADSHAPTVCDRQSRRMKTLEECASFIPAATAADALFQVVILQSEIDTLVSNMEPDQQRSISTTQAEDKISRCLWSLKLLLERMAGFTVASVIGDYAMMEGENPFNAQTQENEIAQAQARKAA